MASIGALKSLFPLSCWRATPRFVISLATASSAYDHHWHFRLCSCANSERMIIATSLTQENQYSIAKHIPPTCHPPTKSSFTTTATMPPTLLFPMVSRSSRPQSSITSFEIVSPPQIPNDPVRSANRHADTLHRSRLAAQLEAHR